MTPEEVVSRARSQLAGKNPTKYELGRGGFHPQSLTAADTMGRCDCSGFVAWCLGASRHIDHPAYLQELGQWVETSAIVRDARRSEHGMFALVALGEARPGMVYVWGDPKSGRGQGHCGIITEINPNAGPWGAPHKVIHCSKGNYTSTGDAIQETTTELFVRNHAIVARCIHVESEKVVA